MSDFTAGPNFRALSSGERIYAYSGVIQGDISVPATIQLLKFQNTGLRDMFLKIQPFYGVPNSGGSVDALGILVTIDGVEIIKSQRLDPNDSRAESPFELFVPKQSTLELLSLNTTNNNTQDRGCNALGWYL